MKRMIFFLFMFCLISSCSKEKIPIKQKLIQFKIISEDTKLETIYKFKYDAKGRLIDKVTPISHDSISYTNQNVSHWFIDHSLFPGFEEQDFYYTNKRLDSIKINYKGQFSGADLIRYIYENNKHIRKVEFRNNAIINVYDFNFNNVGYIERIVNIDKIQNDTLIYSYKYDLSGNVIEIYLNDHIISEFEYLHSDNPFYETSKSYLLNVPIDPYSSETEFITSKKMISKAKHYYTNGIIEKEVINEYIFDENGYPVSGNRIFKGKKENLIFEYK